MVTHINTLPEIFQPPLLHYFPLGQLPVQEVEKRCRAEVKANAVKRRRPASGQRSVTAASEVQEERKECNEKIARKKRPGIIIKYEILLNL